MSAITFDPAKKLDLYFRVNRDGSKTLSFTDNNGNPKDVSGYSFALEIKHLANDNTNVVEFLNVALGRPSTDKVTIPMTSTLSNILASEYYWQLNVTLPDTSVHTWLTGSAIFHEGEFDGLTETTTLTIDESGTAVTVTINETAIAGTQAQVNAGTAASVYVSPLTLASKDAASVALTDAPTIDISGEKHTLTTALGRTFTNSYVGDFTVINITLSATSATFTFPSGYLCSFGGIASGDNTLVITGVVSGDLISVGILKVGNQYIAAAQNYGQ